MRPFREFLFIGFPRDLMQRLEVLCLASSWQMDEAVDFSSALEFFDTNDYKIIIVHLHADLAGLAVLEWLHPRCVFSLLGICAAHASGDSVPVALRLGARFFMSDDLCSSSEVLSRYLGEALRCFDQMDADTFFCQKSLAQESLCWTSCDPQSKLILRKAQQETQHSTPLLIVGRKGSETKDLANMVAAQVTPTGRALCFHDVENLTTEQQRQILNYLCGRGWQEGGCTSWPVLKIVVSTQVDLLERVDQGFFHADLYAFLEKNKITIPALKERGGDVVSMAARFLRECSVTHRFDEDALYALHAYDWPGDVAELKAVVSEAVARVRSKVIQAKDLPAQILENGFYATAGAQHTLRVQVAAPLRNYNDAKKMALNKFHKEYISQLLAQSSHNLTVAAEMAGIDRSNFKKIVKKYSGVD